MIVRTYTGRTVKEALTKVKTELGEGALIIETRPWKEPGLMSPRMGYEVVAAVDDEPQTTYATKPPRTQADGLDATKTKAGPDMVGELAAIRREMARLASGMPSTYPALGELAEELIQSGLPSECLDELNMACAAAGARLDVTRRRAFARLVLGRALTTVIPPEPDSTRRMLVVGPTGVGKTTTIAKLAGELVLKRHARVALVTIDSYRVGAHDQLRAYADLLDVPMEIAATPVELARVLFAICRSRPRPYRYQRPQSG